MTPEAIQENFAYEFDAIRKNALANPNLYNGRYTQKNRKDAYIEFLMDLLVKSTKLSCINLWKL